MKTMAVALAQLVIDKSEYDATEVLGPWARIVHPHLSVFLATRLGHLFLEHEDGTLWFLNTWSGHLVKVCGSHEVFNAQVSEDQQFISEYLMPELVADLLQSGRAAEGDACYSPAVSPGIGGSFDPENFLVMRPASAPRYLCRRASRAPRDLIMRLFPWDCPTIGEFLDRGGCQALALGDELLEASGSGLL
jgi:hypothetical protein